MTATTISDPRPASPPLPGAFLSNPDPTKLYMSASCPELKAESEISSSSEEEDDDDEEGSDGERFFSETLAEEHDEAAFSMDPPPHAEEVEEAQEEDCVSAVEIGVQNIDSDTSARRKLQWKFKGLTLWLELEEFDNDITDAISHFSSKHSSPFIPRSHTTAIYGMEHLSREEASRRLRGVREAISGGVWPKFGRPTGVTSDIAEEGKPGQVCSIAWSELTLATSEEHERALDELYRLFYDDDCDDVGGCSEDSSTSSGASNSTPTSVPSRHRPWKPHNSIAYDNPETNALSLLDTITYMSQHPSLLGRERRVEAISLWSTEGKMEEWICIDRVRFW